MCWRCKAGQDGPNSYRKCGDDAGWRQHRLGPYGILAEQQPMRERAQPYLDHPQLVRDIVDAGTDRARITARQTMREVREAIGLNY